MTTIHLMRTKTTLEVQLNIDCDNAAKECLRNYVYHPSRRPKPSEGAKAALYFGTTMVTILS
jgi:hypothetical protein